MIWPEELSKEIQRLHSAGMKPHEIARIHGLTSNQVRGRLARMRGYESVRDYDVSRNRHRRLTETDPMSYSGKGDWEAKLIEPYVIFKARKKMERQIASQQTAAS